MTLASHFVTWRIVNFVVLGGDGQTSAAALAYGLAPPVGFSGNNNNKIHYIVDPGWTHVNSMIEHASFVRDQVISSHKIFGPFPQIGETCRSG